MHIMFVPSIRCAAPVGGCALSCGLHSGVLHLHQGNCPELPLSTAADLTLVMKHTIYFEMFQARKWGVHFQLEVNMTRLSFYAKQS